MDDPRHEPGMPVLDRQAARLAPAGPGGAAVAVSGGAAIGGSGDAAAVASAAVAGAAVASAAVAGLPPRSVPETRPTRLQKHYILLSAPALVLGAVAITALEMGAGFGSPLVKLCVILGAPLLALANADATVRIWRSAWAWMPVDRGRGLFRLAWTMVALVLYALLLVAAWLVLVA